MEDWFWDGRQVDEGTLAELLSEGGGVVLECGGAQVHLSAETIRTPGSLPGETIVLTLRELGAGHPESTVHLVDFARVGLDHSACDPYCRRVDEAEATLRRITLGVAADQLLRRAQAQLRPALAA